MTLSFRTLLPDTVVALSLRSQLLSMLSEVTRPRKVVDISSDGLSTAKHVLRDLPNACLVYRVPSDSEKRESELLGGILSGFPKCACLAVFEMENSSARELVRVARDQSPNVLTVSDRTRTEEVRCALRDCAAGAVWQQLLGHTKHDMPESLRTIFIKALKLAHEPFGVPALSIAAGIPERSLRQLCESNHWPGPQYLIGWARLHVAAFYLDEPSRTVESIAELLGFPSPVSLRNQIRRYTGVTASTIREGGALNNVARVFEREIRNSIDQTGRSSRGHKI